MMSGDFPDFPDLGIDTWGAILLEPPPPPGERDFKVICSGRTFNLHSKLLVNQSKFFAEQLDKGIKEVEVVDIDPTVFGEVAQYFYDGVIGYLPQKKLAVAEKLGIDKLKDRISEWLILTLTEANVVEVAALAQSCNAKELLNKSVQLIVENSVKVSKDEVVKYPSLMPVIFEEYRRESRVKAEEIAVLEERLHEVEELLPFAM